MTTTTKGRLPKAYLRLDPNVDQTHPDLEGLIRLLCAANRQPQRGRFKNRQLVESILGRARAKRLIERGDLKPEGDRLYVDGWDEWQEGDWTVAERQARIRAKRNRQAGSGPSPERDATVTPPLQEALPKPLPTPTTTPTTTPLGNRQQGSKAEGVTSKAPTAVDVAKPRAKSPTNEPRLTEAQLQSWSTFGPEWGRFKEAWLGRGLLYAPFGSPDDDDTSQRGLLFQVLDARPNDIVRWVREAPIPQARDVITYILEHWHTVREDAGVDDDEWEEQKREERRVASGSMTRLGDLIGGQPG